MRRKDRERSGEEFFAEVFEKAETMFLALHDGEFPYCIPVNFAKIGNYLYIHCAKTGKKLDCIAANPHIGFALAADVRIIREKYTTCYKSVYGAGIAAVVEDAAEKRRALTAIGQHYAALCKSPAGEEDARRVAIIRIEILNLSGKANEDAPEKT